MHGSKLVLPITIATTLLVAAPARADWATEFAASFGALYTHEAPKVSADDVATAARASTHGDILNHGSVTAVGGSFDLSGTINDRVTFPLLGFGGYLAAGPYSGVGTSVDGSIARLRPWSVWRADILLPAGVGVRLKRRRWAFEAGIGTGLTWFHENGSFAAGGLDQQIEPEAFGFLVVGHLDVCRRLDPLERLCLDVSPRIYDFGFMNGANLGVRWEIGR